MNKERFHNLCSRNVHGCSTSVVRSWFEQIEDHYREPHRRYHTPRHVEHCLRQLDSIPGLVAHLDALELAIWYHDVIFDFTQPDNELRSAELFRAHAEGCMARSLVDEVDELIMVTVHSSREPRTGDQEFMVDIDLSSFGLPWPHFLADSIAVREEAPHLTDAEFYSRQVKFLHSLIERPNFCHTRFFRARHEAQARANISRYLSDLESEGFVAA